MYVKLEIRNSVSSDSWKCQIVLNMYWTSLYINLWLLYFKYRQILFTRKLLNRKPPKPALLLWNVLLGVGGGRAGRTILRIRTEIMIHLKDCGYSWTGFCILRLFSWLAGDWRLCAWFLNWENAIFCKIKEVMVLLLLILGQDYK